MVLMIDELHTVTASPGFSLLGQIIPSLISQPYSERWKRLKNPTGLLPETSESEHASGGDR